MAKSQVDAEISVPQPEELGGDQLPVQEVEMQQILISVRAKGHGRFIKRAEVRVGRKPYFTNSQGEAVIKIPTTGDGKVLVKRVRFENLFIEYKELQGRKVYEAFLYPATPGDNEVFIRGEKRPETSKKTIKASESARVSPGGDPVQVTQLLPGVQTGVFGQDIAVRGSGPNDSIYWIDNFFVTEIFHNIGGISVLPEQVLSDVEFYAGGFAPRYGNATGGVIRLLTKTEGPEEPKTEFRINLPIYSALYHERPISDSSWMAVSLRYSYLQYLLPLFLAGSDASDSVVVPYFGDAHALYQNKHEDGGHDKILVMGSQDGLELLAAFDRADRDDGKAKIDLYRGFATIGYERMKPLSSGWSLVGAPQFLYDKTANSFLSDTRVNWNFYFYKFFVELSKRISKDESLYVGIEPGYGQFYADITAPVQSDDPLFDFEDAPRETINRRYDFYYFDAWVSADKKIGNLVVTPGVRGRYDGQLKKSQPDPRLRWRYQLTESQRLKGAYGLYSQAPDPAESNDKFGNPDLDFIKSVHYVLGIESKWSQRWETDLQVYYKQIYDDVVPDAETTYSNNGSIRSRGVEVFIRRNLTDRAFGWLSYTFSKTEDRDSDQEAWRPAEFDQTHVATFAGSYRLTALWDLGTRVTYRTGDTYTPVTDAVYNANLDKYQPRRRDEDRNGKRLPDYQQIDLWMTRDFLFDTWKLALRFGVQYLALTKQVYSRDYNYDYTEEKDFSSLPPIPFIELRGEL